MSLNQVVFLPEEEELKSSVRRSFPRPESPLYKDPYYSQILPMSPPHHLELTSSPLWNFSPGHYDVSISLRSRLSEFDRKVEELLTLEFINRVEQFIKRAKLRARTQIQQVISAPEPETLPDGPEGVDGGTWFQRLADADATTVNNQKKIKQSLTICERTKKSVQLEDPQQHSHMSVEEAARSPDAGECTLERPCKRKGISQCSEIFSETVVEFGPSTNAPFTDILDLLVSPEWDKKTKIESKPTLFERTRIYTEDSINDSRNGGDLGGTSSVDESLAATSMLKKRKRLKTLLTEYGTSNQEDLQEDYYDSLEEGEFARSLRVRNSNLKLKEISLSENTIEAKPLNYLSLITTIPSPGAVGCSFATTLTESGTSKQSLHLEYLQEDSHYTIEEGKFARGIDVDNSTLKQKEISLLENIDVAKTFRKSLITTSSSPGTGVGCSFASTSSDGCINRSSVLANPELEEVTLFASMELNIECGTSNQEDLQEDYYDSLEEGEFARSLHARNSNLKLKEISLSENTVEAKPLNYFSHITTIPSPGADGCSFATTLTESGTSKQSLHLEDLQEDSHDTIEGVFARGIDVDNSTLKQKEICLLENIDVAKTFSKSLITTRPSPGTGVGCSFASTSSDGCINRSSVLANPELEEVTLFASTELNIDGQIHPAPQLMQTIDPVILAPDQLVTLPDGTETMIPSSLPEENANVEACVETRRGDVGTSVKNLVMTTMAKKQNKRRLSETKTNCGRSRKDVEFEDLLQYSHLPLKEAAALANMNERTVRRRCMEKGTTWSELRSMNVSKKSAKAGASSQDGKPIIVKVYGKIPEKFELPSSSKKVDLENEVATLLNLQVGSFGLKYKDKDGDLLTMRSEFNWKDCVETSRSLGETEIKLWVS